MAPLIAADTEAGGLGTPTARWAMVVLWTTGVVQSALLGPPDAWPLFAVAAAAELVATLLVTERGNAVLARPTAVVAAALVVMAAVLMLVAVPALSPWTVYYPSYLAALLIARGSVRAGLSGGGAVVVVVIGFGLAREEMGAVFASLGTPIVALCVGGLWRVGLGFVVRRERAHRTAEARATLAAEASERAADGYRRQLERIRGEVSPLLRRIMAGGELTPGDLVDLQVAEGAIRDRLRSPRVDDHALAAALAAARRRGVRVSLLWGEGPGDPPSKALAAVLAGVLDDVHEGSVVIRAASAQSEVTVVRTTPDGSSRVVLDDRGGVLAVW